MTPWSQNPTVLGRVQELLDEYEAHGVALAHLLCDRHDGDAVAVRLVAPDGVVECLTYAQLEDASRRMAAVLAASGVVPGDRVAVLMGKGGDLVVTLLAIYRLGAVHVPLFTAFAAPAITARLATAEPRVVVTDTDQRHKLDLPTDVVVLECDAELTRRMAATAPWADNHVGAPGDPFIQIYTSGTTGTPKAVTVPRRALAAFVAYLEFGLDVRPEDTYWNAADPGWAYGLYYGIVAPLAAGHSFLMSTAPFTPASMIETIGRCGVTNFTGAPTMYRAVMQRDLGGVSLRRASSAGEPLTPDVNEWAPANLGCDVRDHWGQTEHGMAIGNCWHETLVQPLRPRSMGSALPGFTADVIDGQLVLDTVNSPLMWFTGYLDAPERTRERYSEDGRWYRTGDAARRDGDRFSFVGRDDDVIIMAGYRIGPVDIEEILVGHPLVAEAAVVGRPDTVRGEVLEAFIVLVDNATPDEDLLGDELRERVRSQYGAHAYPRHIHVWPSLPKTPSGKIQRFLLRDADKVAEPEV